ncbi:hypothetical protein B0H13DRAFT_1930232 [Mycena leptocephala]|nr:hypothetical protein B0H13DRAFT_1930232 [Mycena leptocephala]
MAKNGCFRQYLNSANSMPAWILVLSVIIVIPASGWILGLNVIIGPQRSRKVIWAPRTKVQVDRFQMAKNGCFAQYLNSARGIAAWILVLSVIIEPQSKWTDSKSRLETAKNGCFTQYLNSAKGIPAWILVLSIIIGEHPSKQVIWLPRTTIQLDGFKIRTQNGEEWGSYPVFKFHQGHSWLDFGSECHYWFVGVPESDMATQQQNPSRQVQNLAKNGCFTQNFNSAKDIPAWILVLSIIVDAHQSQPVIWAPHSKIQVDGFKIRTQNGEKWLEFKFRRGHSSFDFGSECHYWFAVILESDMATQNKNPSRHIQNPDSKWLKMGVLPSIEILARQVIWAPNSQIQADRFKIWTRNGQKWKVIWAPTAKSKETDSKSGLERAKNGCFTQDLNSTKGIPAWIYLLSIITEQKSKETDSKIWARYGHNGCFTQYLNSAKGIPAWILVLSVITAA